MKSENRFAQAFDDLDAELRASRASQELCFAKTTAQMVSCLMVLDMSDKQLDNLQAAIAEIRSQRHKASLKAANVQSILAMVYRVSREINIPQSQILAILAGKPA